MAVLAQTIKAQTGTACNDALPLSTCNSNIAISNYETWLSFTATDSVYQLTFPSPLDTPRAHIVSIEIYEGVCGAISLKQSFSSGHNISLSDTFFLNNLTPNASYFIKLIKGLAPPTCRICTMVDTSYFGVCASPLAPLAGIIMTYDYCNVNSPQICFDSGTLYDGCDFLVYTCQDTKFDVFGPGINYIYNNIIQNLNAAAVRWTIGAFQGPAYSVFNSEVSYNFTFPGVYLVKYEIIENFFSTVNPAVVIFEFETLVTVVSAQSSLSYTSFSPSMPSCTNQIFQVCLDNAEACANMPVTVTWNMGDGTGYFTGPNCISYQYENPGTYIITAAIQKLCGPVQYSSYTVTVFTLPNLIVSPIQAQICTNNTLQLNASGANSYVWSPSTNLNDANISNPIFQTSQSGNYTYTVTGYNGTCGVSETINIQVNEGVIAKIVPGIASICRGESIQLQAGLVPNIFGPPHPSIASVIWTPSIGLSCTNCLNPIANPSTTTSYTVTITTVDGCYDTKQITITVNEIPQPIEITGVFNLCDNTILNYTTTYCNNNYLYNWQVSGGTIVAQNNCNITVDWTPTGGTIELLVDNNGCSSSAVLDIYPCCLPSNMDSTFIWNNTQVSSILPSYMSNTYTDIYINGIFTVDANIYLPAKSIYMGPDAKILVLPGSSFVTDVFTEIKAGCNYMWDGIYSVYVNSAINISQNSVFKDAQNAIVSRNGGYFTISGSVFDKNYKHFVVENYNQSHTASIVSSQLLCSGGNTLIAPHVGKRTHKAIEINNVRQITIGDASSPTNQNIFDNADYGIYSSLSHIIVKNNSFNNITTRSLYPNENAPQHFPIGTAIAYMGRPVFTAITIGAIMPVLYIGGYNTDELNYFNQNEQNIHVKYRTEFTAVKNNMQNTFLNGIRIDSAFNSNLHILQNTLLNSARGMFLYHNRGANVQILNNLISSNNYAVGEGILSIENFSIAKPYTKQAKYRISNNNVSNYRRGISNYFLTAPQIENNTVQVPPLSINTQDRYGIEVIHSVRDTVISNTVNPVGAPITSTKTGGIYASNSSNSYIACNEVNRLGFGVKCDGNMMYPSKILNNRFRTLSVGFWLSNGGIVGQQGATGNPSDNRWIAFQNNAHHLRASGPITTDGSLSPFYVRASGNFYPANSSVLLNSVPPSIPIDRITTTGPNTIHLCPIQAATFGANLRTAIAQDGIAFSSNEERWMAKYGLYSEIMEDPMLLQGDTVLQQFKDSMEQTNAAIIDSVKAILYDTTSGNSLAIISQAQSLNTAIAPQLVTEQRMQSVFALLIDKIINNDGSFNTSELSLLRSIASECPFIEGEAVYIARSLLFAYDTIGTEYISWCEGNINPSNKIAIDEEETTTSSEFLINAHAENNLKFYPNPVKGQLHVYCQGELHLQQIEIYDLSGRKVFAQDFTQIAKQQIYSLDISHLENGTYISTVWAGGELLHTEKIVLIK